MGERVALIKLVGVWFRYPKSSWVFKDIDVEFRVGETTVVVGPNGSGKTTLLKIAGLLYKPTRGTVLVNGVNPWSLRSSKLVDLRRKIVYVHEKPILLRGTVYDNIAYGLRIRGRSLDEINKAVERIASELVLTDILGRDARRLSSGQAQLVALARALVLDPEIVLLDEPFAHLDRDKKKLFIKHLDKIASPRRGIVVATHDTYIASRIADRVVLVENKKVVETSTVELLE